MVTTYSASSFLMNAAATRILQSPEPGGFLSVVGFVQRGQVLLPQSIARCLPLVRQTSQTVRHDLDRRQRRSGPGPASDVAESPLGAILGSQAHGRMESTYRREVYPGTGGGHGGCTVLKETREEGGCACSSGNRPGSGELCCMAVSALRVLEPLTVPRVARYTLIGVTLRTGPS